MRSRQRLTMLRFVKTGIACALRWTGADELLGALTGGRGLPVVLGYHRVVDDAGGYADSALPGMMISRQMLTQHVNWLGRHFRFVSLDELGERLARGDARDEPLAAVTFDDGYSGVYEHAFPLLRERGIPATVFVVTDLIGTGAVLLHDRLYLLLARAAATGFAEWDLGRCFRGLGLTLPDADALTNGELNPFTATRLLIRVLPQDALRRVVAALAAHVEIDEIALRTQRPLTWEMVAEMCRAGFTVGSHTRSHAVLTHVSAQTVLEEVAGSRRALERTLGVPVRHFAYPGGYFNRAVARAVADSGYRFGYTSCRHCDAEYPLLTIPRTMLWETSCLDARGRFSDAIMSCQIRGVLNLRCRDLHEAARDAAPSVWSGRTKLAGS